MATQTDELILRVSVDAQTGKLKIVDEDLKKLKASSGAAGTEVDKMAAKITTASLAFERKQRAVNNVRDGIIRAQGAFAGFGGELGKVSGHAFALTNQIEDLEFAAKKTGKNIDVMNSSLTDATGAMGKLGVASLTVSAALAGWKIGTFINDTLRLGEAIKTTSEQMALLAANGQAAGNTIQVSFKDAIINGVLPFKAVLESAVAAMQLLTGGKGVSNTDAAGLALRQKNLENQFRMTEAAAKTYAVGLNEVVSVTAKADPIIRKTTTAFKEQAIEAQKLAFSLNDLAPELRDIVNLQQLAASDTVVNVLAGSFLELTHNLELLTPAAATANTELMKIEDMDLSKPIDDSLKFADALGMIAGIVGQLSGIFGKFFGLISTGFSAASAAVSGWQSIMKGGFTNIMGGISSLIGAASMLFSVLKNLFSHDWKKDVQNVVGGLNLSAELMEQLAADAEKFGDAGVAAWKNLSAIISEVGTDAIPLLRDGFSYLEQGIITVDELIDGLNENFQTLADQSTDSLGLLSAEMREIITLSRQFGLEVAAITDYVSGQLASVAEGVNKVATNMRVNTAKEFDQLQLSILTAFNAMIANGATAQEAMAALGPAFGVLSDAMDEFGFNANAALKPLLEMQKVIDSFPKAFARLEGINAQLVGLANSGNLSHDAFKNLERQAKSAFRRILADGSASRAELQSIAPTLQLLQTLSQQFGFNLDKTTQSLIDQANAAGLLNKTSPEDTFARLDETLGRLTDTIDTLTAALLGIPTNISTTVSTNFVTSGAAPATPEYTYTAYSQRSGTSSGTSQSAPASAAPINITVVVPVELDGKMISRNTVKYLQTGATPADITTFRKTLIGLK